MATGDKARTIVEGLLDLLENLESKMQGARLEKLTDICTALGGIELIKDELRHYFGPLRDKKRYIMGEYAKIAGRMEAAELLLEVDSGSIEIPPRLKERVIRLLGEFRALLP